MSVADSASLTPILWLTVFQLGLYACSWTLCGALLGEDKPAVVHWGLFLLLMAAAVALAGLRGEPRTWWAFNGAALLSVLAFAAMRRGLERFLKLRSGDNEQLVMLGLFAVAAVLLDTGAQASSWRVLLTYGLQAYIVLRVMAIARRPIRAEFGGAAQLALVVLALSIAVLLAWVAVRQASQLGVALELHRGHSAAIGAIGTYLLAAAVFNTGFLMLLTQRLLLKLRRTSRRDPLTGLENRGAIDATLLHTWGQSARSGASFAILLIDIDEFKRVNDSHGHAVGDQVLVHVAAAIQAQARQGDSVGRYGGDEFIIVAPQSSLAGAAQAAERLRAALQAEPIHSRGSDLRVTLSIGVAAREGNDLAVTDVLARADRALYKAKSKGRNRVQLSSQPGGDAAQHKPLPSVA
jgi:diguanylate cyclase (GGDEF)-like protein